LLKRQLTCGDDVKTKAGDREMDFLSPAFCGNHPSFVQGGIQP